ncbi:hypothetical protein PFICI_13868 [Pestalotiopsis fici W106-1]|uniref:DUF1479 domain protein n=1 Tax=Pestalotiopsis fici (strain W106-1 / CGMCC3.15140) TaxID=1229662 RepID=W3WLF4_PESFW|nr:uncharacterized protein PFICI_13868 [Pestalotiopsis fici W106-1]ETS74002.1 hypothetical protein PFICI_13868 [Pestalotiopsis fici W106-1]
MMLQSLRSGPLTKARNYATATKPVVKKEGSIADAFNSLSGGNAPPLPLRFRQLKQQIAQGREDRMIASWHRLLDELRLECDIIARKGPRAIPEIEFKDLAGDLRSIRGEIKKRGALVVRNVIPEAEARGYKYDLEEYIRLNPSTRNFEGQVFELYWSLPQLKARSHPNMVAAQSTLMSLWNKSDAKAPISTSQTLMYADRLRIRQPGDAKFALGPHQDGGSVERWQPEGSAGVYERILQGDWENHDPWDASTRVHANINLYDGLGACSMFRMFQGWLSMSTVSPYEGTLLVQPLLKHSTAYTLLRPFFRPVAQYGDIATEEYLKPSNWQFIAGEDMTSELQGATPGQGQEYTEFNHPHLELNRTMVHVPKVRPGDYVVWHCDTIHAVDKTHKGNFDSSVLYIPVCPLTEANARYAATQRQAFLDGTPGPDFPGGLGESQHVQRPDVQDLRRVTDENGLRAAGFEKLPILGGDSPGTISVTQTANSILGF